MKWVMALLGVAMVVIHQDNWNFSIAQPMLLGFLPIGLAYHMAYAVACALFMALMVRFVWPHELEKLEQDGGATHSTAHSEH